MRAEGFGPVWDGNSRLLILGSFPSVKSRQVGFYYGNPQNRFWRTLCGFFGEEIPPSPDEKRQFVLRHRIALWDVVESCLITGSADADIREETVADLPSLLKESRIEQIFCNGTKSYSLLLAHFPALADMTKKLPSTSPANPRFSETVWKEELLQIFPQG